MSLIQLLSETLQIYTKKLPQTFMGWFRYGLVIVFGIVIGIGVWVTIILQSPKNPPSESLITVYTGMTTRDLSSILEHQNIIRSGKLFHIIMSTLFRHQKIIAGDYLFSEKLSTITIARRLVQGNYGNSQIKVMFPEGVTRHEIADSLSQAIPEFRRDEFLEKTYTLEGFLFPDTYLFFRTQSVDTILTIINKRWKTKMQTLQDFFPLNVVLDSSTVTISRFGGSTRSLREMITMASILEREANNADEARIISGILWKRIERGMPMQVDATFKYTIGKESKELTMAELQTDNPYNTYTRTGLPIGPIGNPGIAMITSAFNPEFSEYWYYLHDRQGNIHYAQTYTEHLRNKQNYLK